MAEGWVRLWRKARANVWLRNANRRAIFFTLLLMAQHKPKTVTYMGRVFHLTEGQCVISVNAVADELGLTRKQIRVALGSLKKGQLLGTREGQRLTVVTILNWPLYQQSADLEGQPEGQPEGLVRANLGPTEQEGKKEGESLSNVVAYLPTSESRPHLRPSGTPNGRDGGTSKAEIVRSMLAIWNEHCGTMLPKAKGTPNPTRVQHLLARFGDLNRDMAEWEALCDAIMASRFLTGQSRPKPGNEKPFMATIDWVITKSNFDKIQEGNFVDHTVRNEDEPWGLYS